MNERMEPLGSLAAGMQMYWLTNKPVAGELPQQGRAI